MRSSQIAFVAFMTILLFGLGAVAGVAGANYLGLFDKKNPEPVKEVADPEKKDAERAAHEAAELERKKNDATVKEELAALRKMLTSLRNKKETEQPKFKKDAILVLVAKYDLPIGFAITEDDVQVRELSPGEVEFFERNRGKCFPGSTVAAHFLVPSVKILAGAILMRDLFKDDGLASINHDLDPEMRAVTVSVPNTPAALQLGDCVDVLLTADVQDEGRQTTKTACLARECFVLGRVKMPAVDDSSPDTRPVMFTLEVNPYRAALIEYAKKKGDVKLVGAPAKERPDRGMPRSFTDMASLEYRDEDTRVQMFKKGDLVIGDLDLARIFRLRPPKSAESPPMKTTDKPINPFGPPINEVTPPLENKELPKK